MSNFDDMKFGVEAMTGGTNTVLFDDLGMPSIMVAVNKFNISDVITGGSETVHPAFIVNNTEKDTVYISKFQNIVRDNRAYSLPLRDPAASLNADQALTYCRNKGTGWVNTPYSLWSAIALWSRKNNTMPHGNNNYGQDVNYPLEKATPSMAKDGSGRVQRTATGSGPVTWNHNHHSDGICDLNGNVWEWCSGMRIVAGEIQIIPNANIFDSSVSNASDSSAWKAIKPDGTLVAPGTSGTLHYDSTFRLASSLTAATGSASGSYSTMGLESDLAVPELAKALLIYPDEPNGDYGGDYHYWNVEGERLPICGGYWLFGANAGVFNVNLNNVRSNVNTNIGFRSALPSMPDQYIVYGQLPERGDKGACFHSYQKRKTTGRKVSD